MVTQATHDPLQLVKQLHEILAVGKLRVGFFLGAGCPMAVSVDGRPLVPAIEGLTRVVQDQMLLREECRQPLNRLLSILKEDGDVNPTIESMLNRIRALRDVVGTSTVRGLTSPQLDLLDREISQCISETVTRTLPREENAYHSLARYVGLQAAPAGQIFTTNYDLLIEQGLEAQGVAYFDGFTGSARPFFDRRAIDEDPLPPRWARVWKLHGSVNWRIDKETNVIFRSLEEETTEHEELLIHPSHRKYDESRRMPYFVMMDQLRRFIRNNAEPVALFLLGYSFSDDHINEIIAESLTANHHAAAFALQYTKLADYSAAEKLARQVSNLSVLARDNAVIRREVGGWMARPATDIEMIMSIFSLSIDGPPGGQSVNPNSIDSTTIEEATPCFFFGGDFALFSKFLDSTFGFSAGDSGAMSA